MLFAGFHRLLTVAGALFALSTGAAAADVPAGQTIDGVKCEQMERLAFHIHAHLTILDRGKPLPVPADVGRPLMGSCFYWLHTHTPDGIIHIESPEARTFTLGQFFDVWGAPLSATRVSTATVAKGGLRIWVDGKPYDGDPRSIPLAVHTDIVLEAGAPYAKPAPFEAWNGQ